MAPKYGFFPPQSSFWGFFPTFFVNIYEVPYDLKNDQKKFWPTQKLPSVERFSVLLNSEKSIFWKFYGDSHGQNPKLFLIYFQNRSVLKGFDQKKFQFEVGWIVPQLAQDRPKNRVFWAPKFFCWHFPKFFLCHFRGPPWHKKWPKKILTFPPIGFGRAIFHFT